MVRLEGEDIFVCDWVKSGHVNEKIHSFLCCSFICGALNFHTTRYIPFRKNTGFTEQHYCMSVNSAVGTGDRRVDALMRISALRSLEQVRTH